MFAYIFENVKSALEHGQGGGVIPLNRKNNNRHEPSRTTKHRTG